jgi:peroxiredoxin/uncharacterized tellurite resistance protein B-like protein
MFLRFLDPRQRQALLLMAYRMVAADGVVHPDETSMLEALRHELSVPAPKREDYANGPDLTAFTDRRAKLAAMLKLASIAYSDRDFHPEEVRVLVRFGRTLEMSAEDMRAIDSWVRRHESLVREATDLIGPAEDASTPPEILTPASDPAPAALEPGTALPSLRLPLAAGGDKDIAAIPGRAVIFCYPVTVALGQKLPESWAAIPEAQDCTAHFCAWRDRHDDFRQAGIEVLALSAQTSEHQKEMSLRLGLRFGILSDSRMALAAAIRLPVLEIAGVTMLQGVTLAVRDGIIEHVFQPISPAEPHVEQVLAWLSTTPSM